MRIHATGRGRAPGRLFAALLPLALLVLSLVGCGGSAGTSSSFLGSAGVSNGTVVGTVFGIVGGAGIVPLPGVTVTARRQAEPPLMRTTRTDSSGGYRLGDVPLGEWEISYTLRGYSGGGTTRVYVESGGLSPAPDVYMSQAMATGSGQVVIHVVDGATGAPVLGATATLGGFSPSWTGLDGSYGFDVAVTADPSTGLARQLAVVVQHPGYPSSVPRPATVAPVAGAEVVQTVSLEPAEARIAGQLQVSTMNSLYASAGALGQVTISSPQVSSSYLQPVVDPSTGWFSVRVPPSTQHQSRFVDLVFTSPHFQQQVVSGVMTPGPGGTANLSTPVVLVPHQAVVTGAVLSASGFVPSGPPSQVVVVETGQAATPVGGSYQLVGVPTGLPLTLQASVVGPYGAEFGSARITPVGGGTFTAPPILTR